MGTDLYVKLTGENDIQYEILNSIKHTVIQYLDDSTNLIFHKGAKPVPSNYFLSFLLKFNNA